VFNLRAPDRARHGFSVNGGYLPVSDAVAVNPDGLIEGIRSLFCLANLLARIMGRCHNLWFLLLNPPGVRNFCP
jgi:hypothetical protein